MVGKPKEIVRGRPMTAEEEAAYVREVARQKTAALRMSLDAVERQGMPFVGETGGVGAGQGMGEVPARSAASAGSGFPQEADDLAAARPRGARRGGPPRAGRRAAGAAPGEDAAMIPFEPVDRAYVRLALRLGRHIDGLIDGYFGPPEIAAAVDAEPLRPPAALRDEIAALTERLGEIDDPARRRWLAAQLVALDAQARLLAGDGLAVPRPRHRLLRLHAGPDRRSGLRGSGRRPRPAPAGRGLRRGADGRLGRALHRPGRPAPRRRRRARPRLPRAGRRPVRPPGRASTSRSRSSRTSRGAATTGSTANSGAGSRSTPTSRSGRRTSCPSSPTKPTRATTSSTPGTSSTSSAISGGWRPASSASTRPSASSRRAWPISGAGLPSRTPEVDLLGEIYRLAGPPGRP